MNVKLNLFSAPLLILLVDALPVAVVEQSPGKYRLSVGASSGDYEYKSFDCDGGLTAVGPVEYNTVGGRVDVISSKTRISAFGGQVFSGRDVSLGIADDYDGFFGGVQVAGEWEKFGLGFGVVSMGGEDGFVAPSFYLRGGGLKGLHFQFDVFPPTEILGNTGWVRLGLGSRRFLGGVSMAPYTYSDQFEPRLFGEYDFPLSPRIDLYLGGQLGMGEHKTQWGLGSGVRVYLGPVVSEAEGNK